MIPRVLPKVLGVLAVAALLATERLPAQDDPLTEIASLKQVVAEQGKQIEALAAQVAKLVARLEDGTASGTEPMAAPTSTQAAPLVATPLATEPEAIPYVVEKGDSLEKIAKSCGTTTSDLQKLNNITDPNKLRIGQTILLPAGPPPQAEP